MNNNVPNIPVAKTNLADGFAPEGDERYRPRSGKTSPAPPSSPNSPHSYNIAIPYPPNRGSVPLNTTSADGGSSSSIKIYYLCSLRRNQSALWTTFRLFLDGTKELNISTGELTNFQQFDTPIFLFGTKKLKSGISAQCFIWRSADSKYWKEKYAVGKITRNDTFYQGLPMPLNQIQAALAEMSASNATSSSTNSVGGVSGNNSTLEIDVTNLTSRQSFSVPSSQSTSGPFSTAELMHGGPIAIVINSRGMEKLIHVTAVLPLSSRMANTEISSGTASPTGHSSNSIAASLISLVSEDHTPSNSYNALLMEMETVVKNPALSTPSNIHRLQVLRSKLPRKLYSSGNSSAISGARPLHGVAFGKESRVKAPSRKNVVLDTLFDAEKGAFKTEWAPDSDRVPAVQIGKMDEDLFAVDFHSIGPFQVMLWKLFLLLECVSIIFNVKIFSTINRLLR